MIDYFFEFVILIFLFFVFAQILKFCLYLLYLWQIVEYRVDRFLVRSNNIGDLKELVSYFNLFNLHPFNKYPRITLRTMLSIILLGFGLYQLLFVFYRNLIKFSFLKDEFIVTLLIVVVLLYWLTPLLTSLITVFISQLLWPIKRFIIFLARKKIESLDKLLVIGITGSYGKSSTKEIVAQVVGLKYKVVKTPFNVNTEIGAAKTILLSLSKKTEVFVVEIGAYKTGEVEAICDLVKPKIGILTGINEQHLALFGSLRKTKKAKFELIRGLPEDGLVLFNINNQHCRNLVRRVKQTKTIFYGRSSSQYEEAIDAGVKVGQYLKIPATKINKIIPSLKKKLALKKEIGRNNSLVFDDSYSSNSEGFNKALAVISQYKKKKLVVTPGIIDLGKASSLIHRKIGKSLGQIADRVIITNQNFARDIKDGAGKEYAWKFFVSKKEADIIEWLGRKPGRNWVILIEGRVPLNIKSIFKKPKK